MDSLPVFPSARSRMVIALCCHVLLPVLIGAGIYTLWRSNGLLVFEWYRWAGVYEAVEAVRRQSSSLQRTIPSFVRYSLPDALWVYAFTALMCLVWAERLQSKERTFWVLLPLCVAIGSEFGQLIKVVPGTFDWADVLGYIAAFAGAYIITSVQYRWVQSTFGESANET